jgi:hypothetical protein
VEKSSHATRRERPFSGRVGGDSRTENSPGHVAHSWLRSPVGPEFSFEMGWVIPIEKKVQVFRSSIRKQEGFRFIWVHNHRSNLGFFLQPTDEFGMRIPPEGYVSKSKKTKPTRKPAYFTFPEEPEADIF